MGSNNEQTLRTYEEHAQRYVETTPQSLSLAVYELIARLVELAPQGRVLEIGSGPGTNADYLELFGMHVQRTDAARAFVERLRADGKDAMVLDAIADDLGGPYDVVFANAVFVHFSRAELAAVLDKAFDAVRPGGLLAFTLKEGDGEGWSSHELDAPRHFTYWRPDGLRAVLDGSPWELLELTRESLGEWPWLVALCRRG